MALLFNNNALTTLTGAGINNSQTTFSVAAGTGSLFPAAGSGNTFNVTVQTGTTIEIMSVTNRSGDVFTVVRGQDGTTASAFPATATVDQRLTAGDLNAFVQSAGGGITPGLITGGSQYQSIQSTGSVGAWANNLGPNLTYSISAGNPILTGTVPTDTVGNVALIINSPSTIGNARLLSVRYQNTPVFEVGGTNGPIFTYGNLNVGQALSGTPAYVTAAGMYSNVAGGNTLLNLSGVVTDGSTAVATAIGSYNTFSTAGSKLVSFRNSVSEKAFVQWNGSISTTSSLAYGVTIGRDVGAGYPGLWLAVAPGSEGTSNYALLTVDGNNLLINSAGSIPSIIDFRSANTPMFAMYFDGGGGNTVLKAEYTNAFKMLTNTTDSSSAVGYILDTVNSFATTGGKILSIRNNGTEQFYVDRYGQISSGASAPTSPIAGLTLKAVGSQAANLFIEGTGGIISPNIQMRMPGDTSTATFSGYGTCAIGLGGGTVPGFQFAADGNGSNYFLAAKYPDAVITTYGGATGFHHYQSYNGSAYVEHIKYGNGTLSLQPGGLGTLNIGTGTGYLYSTAGVISYSGGPTGFSGAGLGVTSISALASTELLITSSIPSTTNYIQNFVPFSCGINGINSAWIATSGVVSPPTANQDNTYADPWGNITLASTAANKLTFPQVIGASAFSYVYVYAGSQYIGNLTAATYTASVYMRSASTTQPVYIFVYTNPSGTPATYSRLLCNVTSTWQRFSFSWTASTSAWGFAIGCDLRDGGQTTQAAATVWATGAQIELGSSATNLICNAAYATSSYVKYRGSIAIDTGTSALVPDASTSPLAANILESWNNQGIQMAYVDNQGNIGVNGLVAIGPFEGMTFTSHQYSTLSGAVPCFGFYTPSGVNGSINHLLDIYNASTLALRLDGASQLSLNGSIIPLNAGSQSIGSNSSAWANLYLASAIYNQSGQTIVGIGGSAITTTVNGPITEGVGSKAITLNASVYNGWPSGSHTVGSKLVSIQTGNIEVAAIDYLGNYFSTQAAGYGSGQLSIGGTQTDSTQITNLVGYSNQLQNWTATGGGVTGAAPTVTGNTTDFTDLYGNNNATKIVFAAVTGAGYSYLASPATFTASNTYFNGSCWLRASSGTPTVYLFAFTGTTYYSKTCTLSTSWQRFNFNAFMNGTFTMCVGFDLRTGGPGGNAGALTIYAQGMQVENTGTASYSGLPPRTLVVTPGSASASQASCLVASTPPPYSTALLVTAGTRIHSFQNWNGVELSWVDNQGFYVSQYGGIGSTTGQTKIQGATLHTVRTLSATTLTVDTTTTDYIILVQTTTIGATCTITLPNPALNIGRILFIKDSQGTANTHNIVIARFGSESIEGVASSYTMTAAWDSKQITTDGTNWFFL